MSPYIPTPLMGPFLGNWTCSDLPCLRHPSLAAISLISRSEEKKRRCSFSQFVESSVADMAMTAAARLLHSICCAEVAGVGLDL